MKEHLRAIPRRWHAELRDAIGSALRFEPDVRSGNRKPVEEPSALGGGWELRCGPTNCLRVFCDVDNGQRVVRLLAVGHKIHERLYLGGEEFEL